MAWAAIGAAAIGAGASYMSSRQQASAAEDASSQQAQNYNQANANTGMPRWTEQQEPYVWGNGYNFPMPELSQEALDYGGLLAAGGTAAGPMGWDQLMNSPDALNSLLGYGMPQAPQGAQMWNPMAAPPEAQTQALKGPQQAPEGPPSPQDRELERRDWDYLWRNLGGNQGAGFGGD